MTNAPASPNLTFVAVGNTMFQRRLSAETDPHFHELLEIVHRADAAFVNVEAPIFEPSAYPVKQYIYSSYVTAEPWLGEELRWAGFNLASLANNHMSDWSPEAAETNRRILRAAGVIPTGTGATLAEARAPGYLDTTAGRLALISVDSSYEFGEFNQPQMASDPHGEVRGRPGANGLRWDTSYELDSARFEQLREIHRELALDREGPETAHSSPAGDDDSFTFRGIEIRRGDSARVHTRCHPGDLEEILRWVRTAASQADYVVVSHHTHNATGEEWELPADYAREFAHAVIDAGAHAYLGHGYAPKGIEFRNGRPIVHDVGWFARQDTSARRHPGDAYSFWGLGRDATPGDFADAREEARARGAKSTRAQLVRAYAKAHMFGTVVRLEFKDGELASGELYPNMPSRAPERHRRGTPARAHGEQVGEWFDRLRRASEPFGTKLELADGVARIGLPPGDRG